MGAFEYTPYPPFQFTQPASELFAEATPWPRGPDPNAEIVRGSELVEAAIAVANTLVDVKWQWEGRNTVEHPGLDCRGLVFLAFGAATHTAWQEYPIEPSRMVSSGMLGAPVNGLDGVARGNEDRALLKRGDVVYFLMDSEATPDQPLWTHLGHDYWPWHVGIYVDEGRQFVLNAHPDHDMVRMPLGDIKWDALFVTRPVLRS